MTGILQQVHLWSQYQVTLLHHTANHTISKNSIFNPFQSNFSANRILPSSYLFIPAIFLQAQPCEYNAQSSFHIKTHGLSRNRKCTTCAICWPKSVYYTRKSVGQAPTAERAQQNRVGRLPTLERNGKIIMSDEVRHSIGKGK